MGMNPYIPREVLFEDGGVLTDEFNRAEGNSELLLVIGDGGEWEGLGRLQFNEVLEVHQWLEILLFLNGVVEAAVSDEVELDAIDEGPELEVVVVVAVREEVAAERNGERARHLCGC